MKNPLRNVHLPSGPLGALVVVLVIGFGALTIAFHDHVAGLVAAATSTLQSPPVLVFFTPNNESENLTVGGTASVDLDINAQVPINSLGATISYPKDDLEVVDLSKERSFLNLWTEDTTIKEDRGQVEFSGGTTHPGGVTGTSTVLTITVRAKKPGNAELSVSNVQVFAADGKGTAVTTGTRSLTFHIAAATTSASTAAGGSGGAPSARKPQPAPPSADLNGDGKVTMVDASILMFHMVLPYNPRYDLNRDGNIGLADLSIIFAQMGS